MKTILPYSRTGAFIAFAFIFLFSQDSFCQDSLSESFTKGVPASSFSASAGFQSANLMWGSASFPSSANLQAGYLIIYSTSNPMLIPSPNGYTPDYAVLNGTIVGTTATNLPTMPATSATEAGLTNGTTYYFLIVAYVWDGVNTSTYQYSSPSTICLTIPPSSPDSLNLSSVNAQSTSISGSFNQPLLPPSGYVVSYSKNATAPPLENGTNYESGQAISGDTVIQNGNSTSFNTNNSGYQLASTSNYYIHVFSYVISKCNNQPVYSLGYLSQSVATTQSKTHDSTSSPENLVEVIDVEPNPVVTTSWLRITTLTSDNNVSVTIYTIEGRMLVQKNIQVLAGVNRISLNTDVYKKGAYVVKVIFSSGKTKAIEFIKR